MSTLTAFINGYNKSLAQHLAEELKHVKKADVTAELLLGLIKAHKHGDAKPTPKKDAKSPAKKDAKSPAKKDAKDVSKPATKSNTKTKKADAEGSESDDFEAFGKFKSMAILQKAHDKAVAENKYVNAKTGSVVQDSTRNRNAGVLFYDSNVCGEDGTEELEAILKHFPGSLVEAPEATPKKSEKKTPAKKTPTKGEDSSDFEAFGKFTTMEKLKKAHDKAVEQGKYVNASTGSIMQDSKANRNKGVIFYDSNVCGVADSEELKAILSHFPGEEVEAEEPTSVKKSPKRAAKSLKPKEEESEESEVVEVVEVEELGELGGEAELEFEEANVDEELDEEELE